MQIIGTAHYVWGRCIRLLRKLRLRSTAWLLESCTQEPNVIQGLHGRTAHPTASINHQQSPGEVSGIPSSLCPANLCVPFPSSTWPTISMQFSIPGPPEECPLIFQTCRLVPITSWRPTVFSNHSPFAAWKVENVWLVLRYINIAWEHISSPQQRSTKPQLLNPAERLRSSRQAEHRRSSAHKAKMAPPQSEVLPRMDRQIAHP